MDSNSHRLSPLYYKRTEIYTEILDTKIRDTEILCRDLCNTIANLIRKLCDDIITSEVYAGQEFGCETAVHAMYKVYKEEHN